MNDYEKYGEYSRQEEPDGASSAGSTLKTALICVAVGMGVGAVVSLLLAPSSGAELRETLRGKFDGARRSMGDQTARLRSKGWQVFSSDKGRAASE